MSFCPDCQRGMVYHETVKAGLDGSVDHLEEWWECPTCGGEWSEVSLIKARLKEVVLKELRNLDSH